ncbi:MAG: hypothetical protein WBB45_14565 [Cyclobacteriaceae bacterium]
MKKTNRLSLTNLKVYSFPTSEIKATKGGETFVEYSCHPETCNNNVIDFA